MRCSPNSGADDAVPRRVLPDSRRASRDGRELVAREPPGRSRHVQPELEAAVRLLENSPLIGKAYPQAPIPEVRRLLIGRSRYHLYWEVDVTTRSLTILAVWYAGRGSGPRL